MLGIGNGSFGSATTYSTESARSERLGIGDINGDGVADIVTAGLTDAPTGESSVFLSRTVDGVAPLLDFSLKTQADALQALPIFQRKLDQLSEQRGQIGAFESRVNTATDFLQVTRENYAAATSKIMDADIAEETAELVRAQVLQQAATAILAQANQEQSLVLALLGGGGS